MRCSLKAWSARLRRGWMVLGAVCMGIGASPTYVLAMQGGGNGVLVGMPRDVETGGGAAGGTPDTVPAAVPSHCPPLSDAYRQPGVIGALQWALQGNSYDEVLARVPASVRGDVLMKSRGPLRFDQAMFGATANQMPGIYYLPQQARVGVGVAALASHGTAFTATLDSMELLDLASVAHLVRKPDVLLEPGAAIWSVTGRGVPRGGGASRPFGGSVYQFPTPQGLLQVLAVERDAACPLDTTVEFFVPPQRGVLLSLQNPVGQDGALPPYRWPEFPLSITSGVPPIPDVIGPYPPCVDVDCMLNAIRQYRRDVQAAIDTLDQRAFAAWAGYQLAVRAVEEGKALYTLYQRAVLFVEVRECVVGGMLMGWLALLGCLFKVYLKQKIMDIIKEVVAQRLIDEAKEALKLAIQVQLRALQDRIYDLHNQLRANLHNCLDPGCLRELAGNGLAPPAFPTARRPPWYPLDPGGFYGPSGLR